MRTDGIRQRRLKSGGIKVKTKFLWFPVIINDERRWLEKATVKYVGYRTWNVMTGSKWVEWRPKRFINK